MQLSIFPRSTLSVQALPEVLLKPKGSRFRSQLAGIAISMLISAQAPYAAQPQMRTPSNAPPAAAGYKLVFCDDFDTLNLSPDGQGTYTWYRDVWFSHKHALPSNIKVSGSELSLVWRRGQPSPDTSIETLAQDKVHASTWRYGYFEVRAKWDTVTGAWPAFWLIPVQMATGKATYGGVKESGELDIFEGQGAQPHTFFGTIHDWVGMHDSANKVNHYTLPQNVDLSRFHVYGVLWTLGKVTWYLDDQPLHSEPTPAIFDKQDFFLVLGMQEGVNWKSGELNGVDVGKMTTTIDWVRVWQK